LEDLCFDAQQAAESLAPYAVMTRYPTLFGPLTEEQYEAAVALAQRVVRRAEQQLEDRK
jgi:hypothetical protein